MTAELLAAEWQSGPGYLPLWHGDAALVDRGDTVTYYQTLDGTLVFVSVEKETELGNA